MSMIPPDFLKLVLSLLACPYIKPTVLLTWQIAAPSHAGKCVFRGPHTLNKYSKPPALTYISTKLKLVYIMIILDKLTNGHEGQTIVIHQKMQVIH